MSTQGPLFLRADPPTDPHDARRTNRSRVLHSLIMHGPASRAELSRRLGLSRPTISVIANELLTSGVLAEGDRISSGGAPGTLLEMAKDGAMTIVADLAVPRRLRMAAVAINGEVVTHHMVEVDEAVDALPAIVAFAERLEPDSALGVVLAVPDWVGPNGEWAGRSGHATDAELAPSLRQRLRKPVFAVNAVDAMTVADMRDSPADRSALASIVVAEQIGIGLVLNGRLFATRQPGEGDLTHIAPGTPGPTCPECGRMCLRRQVMALGTGLKPEARESAAAALAAVTAPVIATVGLQEVVLAGLPGAFADDLADRTRAGLALRLPAERVPVVRASRRGPDAVMLGAAALMLFRHLG
ncbi:MAG TPA: ROK family protein [Actinomycetota bacterium]|nr:ROK family protein [Actinomycetota bacterium]